MIRSIPLDSDAQVIGIQIGTLSQLREVRGDELLRTPHRVEFNALIFVTEGKGFHYIDNKMYVCREGTLFLLSPHQVHSFDSDFSWKGYIVSFQDSEVFPVDNMGANLKLVKSIRSVDVITEVQDLVATDFRQLYEECRNPVDMVSGTIQRNILQNIMFKIFYRTSFSESAVKQNRELKDYQRFSDHIEQHFREQHNISEYIEELGTTAKRLNNLCKKVKGVSAKHIIDARLLLEAKRLIGYTKMPISEIALSLGFQDPTNLTKFFRRHTNTSPTEFRNMSKFFSE